MSVKDRTASNAKETCALLTFKLFARGYKVNFAATATARTYRLAFGFKPTNLPKSRDSLKIVHLCNFNKR